MKSIKQLLFTGLATMLILSSCTMEKRVYMSGYHIEWNKSKHNPESKEIASNDNGKEAEQNQIGTVVQAENESNTVENSATVSEDNITASVDNSLIIPNHKLISFSNQENRVTAKTNSTFEAKKVITNKVTKTKKKVEKQKSAAGGGGKSQIVALILCIFLGGFGIHRFYLGYTGAGILYLLTGGLFGIGWLIDIVLLIIPNGLTPKGKSSYKE